MRQIRPIIAPLVLGCFLILSLMGMVLTRPAQAFDRDIATAAVEQSSPSTVDTQGELKSAIKGFLTAQPERYYALMSVDALKKVLYADRDYPLQEEVVLIDVRTPKEYSEGHIPTAVNIPVEVLVDNLDLIPEDKTIVLYCSTGYRTAMGVEALHLLGYNTVEGFAPGFRAWRETGEAIEIG